ncbi:alpha/beta hydrolase fold protein [Caballeronia arationis]|jgi:DNA-binding SARP family transcriptional activator/pimeloyl-ACP methyl ester carboxylesterase|uniref:DNA-binding transcriptional activator of the SARP family n=1 Tax=Caballeronia arationis TaxID=1777142 RepID=A0A7Z7I4I1_9BURK|nr:alpha/beta hydrolase [Caballeronia arationis]SAL06676.1 alpha/beta hydrolase fold protein [Caballeronia arationis]SOE54755.1 DNA-binding transcriptional activator of the SARP family [Caballeronia arationis]
MTLFSVRTLGFPEIRRDDRLCDLALRKGLALLIYLAEAKGSVGRDVVATMLWPENREEVVRARLRRLLHRLQLTLGNDVLTIDRSTVRWSSGIDLQVDAQLFEQACDRGEFERACRHYSGDFLEGFSPGDCPQFDEWAFFRREALRGRAIQALERVVHDRNAAGAYAAAAAHAGRLVELDPLSEVYGRHLIRNLLLAGDRAAAERHLEALTQRLRDELDVAPETETGALLIAGATPQTEDPPPTRFVSGRDVHLAFQTYGAGRIDILVLPGFVSHVERVWEEPRCRAFLSSLAEMGRLILLDRRGVGLSDRVGFNPSVDATAQDIGTVLDAAGSRRVVLFGASEGGPACIKFAADQPDRVAGLILFGSLAKGSATPDYPHALQARQYDIWLHQLAVAWGSPAGIETFAPSLSGDPQARAWWAGLLRAASSPGAIKGVIEALRDMDVRHLLGRISVPTLVLHRHGDRAVRVGAGRHLASHIAQARFVELDGSDHWAFAGDQQSVLASIKQFVHSLAACRRA